jgi:phosphoglycolate phosphatase-like HAD superfamily hydrolase
MQCKVVANLQAFRALTENANWLVLSWSDQAEIIALFAKRDLAKYFDGGLFGSPDNKDEVLASEKADGNIKHPTLFIGDSKYDYETANRAGLDVVFLSD